MVDWFTTSSVPNPYTFFEKNWKELRQLTFTQVSSDCSIVLGPLKFLLSDGSTCAAGLDEYPEFDQVYTFDPSKKITRIECIKNRGFLDQLKFYHYQELLVSIGSNFESPVHIITT
jgi:hypothetical protein